MYKLETDRVKEIDELINSNKELSFQNDEKEKKIEALIIANSELKKAEEKIIKANRLYYIISHINQMIVHTTDELTLFKEICNISIELGKFRMAWLGIVNEKTQNVIPVAHCGEENGYLSEIKPISFDNVTEGRGPTGTAFREGKYSVCNDIEKDPKMAPWKTEALNRGYYSSIALPIKKAGKVMGIFSLYASEPGYFDEKEIALLDQIAEDISFGLDYFENEKQRIRAEKEITEKEFFLRESQKVGEIGSYELNFITGYWKSSEMLDSIFGIDQNQDRSIEGWVEIIHPDDRLKMDEYLRIDVIGKQKSFNKEYQIVRISDGQTRCVHGLGDVKFDNTGNITEMIGTIQDITERKKAEKQKEYDSNNLKALINNTKDEMWSVDRDLRLITSNETFDNNVKLYTGKIINAGSKILESGFGTEQLNRFRGYYERAFSGESFTEIEYNAIPEKSWREISFYPIKNENVIIGAAIFARNITERKKSEEALAKSENYLRTIIQSEPECIKLVNKKSEVIEMNPAGLAMIEADSIEQVRGNSLLKVIKPQYIKAFEKLTREVFEGKSGKLEFEITGLKGKNKWMKTHAVPFKNVEGEIISLLGITRDITKSKETEREIRTLYQAIEQTNAIIYMTDVNGTINFVNTAFEEVYGYKKEEVVGKATPRILKSEVMKKQFYEELWKNLTSGKSLRKEIVNKTKDGRLITIQTSWTPIFNDRKILIGYMAVQEDITEKKIAEKKLLEAELMYRTLFEQSADGISVVDPETLLPLDFNEKMHTQLGYSREEFAQLKIFDYEIKESLEAIKARAEKIMHEGQDSFETRHKTKKGDIRNVQVNIISIILHGKPQFYATYRDITEKIKLERERKQQEIDQQRQIVEATINGQEKEKNELGNELHDNINQILATVKIYLGMAKPKEKTSEDIDLVGQSYDYLNIAMEEIRKLTHSLVAPSLGNKGIHESLNKLIEEINATRDFKVALVDEMEKKQPLDDKKALMLYRITQEQMNNINKYAQAKNVIVHLKEKDAHLELSITDDGVGFDTTKKANGIGLKNIQSRVEFYSGKINIISSPGKGCKMELSIPI